MDFTFSEEQLAVGELAATIFGDLATVDRIKEVADTDDRVDRRLWSELAKANLLGIALPEAHGGSGLGMTELCLVLEQLGRTLAPVPLVWTAAAALTIAEFAPPALQASLLPAVIAGDLILSTALTQPGIGDPFDPSATFDGSVSGSAANVPLGDQVLMPARTPDGLVVVLLDPAAPGVTARRSETTNHQIVTQLTFDGAAATVVAEGPQAIRFATERALVGLCAVQLGVAEAALAQAATYTSNRVQFGKPLSSFQSTSARAADAYIDTEAMRATLWQAAWRMDCGLDASTAIEVAKWWASEAGQRVVHAAQHMHGGIGADVAYPVHRYFLWGKQIEDTLGGGSSHLAAVGRALAAGPVASA
ncbi:MAG: acyl-CoA dehydrogenase family protein [Acidimicrobiales bacterium]